MLLKFEFHDGVWLLVGLPFGGTEWVCVAKFGGQK